MRFNSDRTFYKSSERVVQSISGLPRLEAVQKRFTGTPTSRIWDLLDKCKPSEKRLVAPTGAFAIPFGRSPLGDRARPVRRIRSARLADVGSCGSHEPRSV